jgi:hypothetical protein
MKQNQFSKVRVRVPEMIILTLIIGAVNVVAIVIMSGNVLGAIEFFWHILFNQNNRQGVCLQATRWQANLHSFSLFIFEAGS